MTGQQTSTGAAGAAQHPMFEKVARAGQAASGVVHLLIAYVVIQVAFGDPASADQSGALRQLAAQPGGRIVLWVLAVTLTALAVWRLVEAAVGKRSDLEKPSALDRVKTLGVAVAYLALALTAFQFARGSGKSSSEQNAGLSARLMQSGGGKVLLVAAGLVIIGIGAYHVYKGAAKKFLDDLHRGRLPRYAEPLGVVGYVAKGLAIAGAGVLVLVATFTADPSKATGLDGALKTLGTAPFGQILLVAAGLGIAAYGVYCFVLARYGKM
ncbi:membrane protein [Rhodococcus ruber Chol-4]|uniref:Putative integral membrane protein n=1 Tax=Rhodococcus ruber TaxID=1830 RepID=A0A098BW02_9NOCA|nr:MULTISPECIES: DUF1206 domain-containing protein [Rhodococcus]MDO2377822.1 DUF1206 domain-containing protein [Rhodococcus ruber]RIK09338.1 MAG: DUF1206 domain-containing protein [Acidobacteriota bacterium]ATQ31460.1 DUF1206 domain-containing protein [Rhodococcus ruber]AUM15913.1 DUF1206 domain-containing protein [Rhodococcus ruber]AWG98395.1 DUF1206 domain-containing protein [Rhodococcus ruber]